MGMRRVILVADDDLPIRTFIREILVDEGYDVLVAADGNEAVALSRAHPGVIDLMLTDLQMPHLDGLSAFHRISAERSEMKVLFISGDPFRAQFSERWPFLSKPFRLHEMLTTVHAILEDARQAVHESVPSEQM